MRLDKALELTGMAKTTLQDEDSHIRLDKDGVAVLAWDRKPDDTVPAPLCATLMDCYEPHHPKDCKCVECEKCGCWAHEKAAQIRIKGTVDHGNGDTSIEPYALLLALHYEQDHCERVIAERGK